MTRAEKKPIIQRLKNFKINYNYTSKQIAQELNTTEAAVSHWFSGDSFPRADKIDDILKFLEKHCIPGIIRIPKNKHWLASFFLRVEDINDPYHSWIDDNISGEYPEAFSKWVKDWEQQFPSPVKYRSYDPTPQGRAQCHLDTLNLNTTIHFRDNFKDYTDLISVFQNHKGLNLQAFDYILMKNIISGEDDGTS